MKCLTTYNLWFMQDVIFKKFCDCELRVSKTQHTLQILGVFRSIFRSKLILRDFLLSLFSAGHTPALSHIMHLRV